MTTPVSAPTTAAASTEISMFLACSLAVSVALISQAERPFAWDARAAEHLLNRAGFGATTEEVQAAVTAGMAATIEKLVRAQPIAATRPPARSTRLAGRSRAPEDPTRGSRSAARTGSSCSPTASPRSELRARAGSRGMIQEGDPLARAD